MTLVKAIVIVVVAMLATVGFLFIRALVRAINDIEYRKNNFYEEYFGPEPDESKDED